MTANINWYQRYTFGSAELNSYDPETCIWSPQQITFYTDTVPFVQDGIKRAHMVCNCNLPNWLQCLMVLILSTNYLQQTEREARMQVIMRANCIRYADQFNQEQFDQKRLDNKTLTPQKITFVPCKLVKFNIPWIAYEYMERFMFGNFVNSNIVDRNHDGLANIDSNIQHAFSHFTFENSGKKEIVMFDFSGFGNTYIEPKLYIVIKPCGNNFVEKNFLQTHTCNSICKALDLTAIDEPNAGLILFANYHLCMQMANCSINVNGT